MKSTANRTDCVHRLDNDLAKQSFGLHEVDGCDKPIFRPRSTQ